MVNDPCLLEINDLAITDFYSIFKGSSNYLNILFFFYLGTDSIISLRYSISS